MIIPPTAESAPSWPASVCARWSSASLSWTSDCASSSSAIARSYSCRGIALSTSRRSARSFAALAYAACARRDESAAVAFATSDCAAAASALCSAASDWPRVTRSPGLTLTETTRPLAGAPRRTVWSSSVVIWPGAVALAEPMPIVTALHAILPWAICSALNVSEVGSMSAMFELIESFFESCGWPSFGSVLREQLATSAATVMPARITLIVPTFFIVCIVVSAG